MNARDLKWSKTEKEAARKAYDAAYQRECAAIREKLREMVDTASEPKDIWKIHDYLSEQRDRTDNKYDYRYSVLPFVFARLLKEGWLTAEDFEGLKDEKIEIIESIASFDRR